MTDPADCHPAVIRVVPHPDELRAGGATVRCPHCNARRDWLLLNVNELVFIRCRCAHEWPEPCLARTDFDQHFAYPEQYWDDATTAMTALGFDGFLAGTTWG
ncbi:hypothetical protein [Streptacidiphilus cavernicola]|uniref:Uncharacterized protein n=1 Tax=Streptacidiphilus cavernicola TaxID=3342716 RepID=A0ABV6VVK9_9ACTN